MKLTDGFRLSDEQRKWVKEKWKECKTYLDSGEARGSMRVAAKQEALALLWELDKIEQERIAKLGDNAALVDFVQAKEN